MLFKNTDEMMSEICFNVIWMVKQRGYKWNKIGQGLVTTKTGWRLHGDSSYQSVYFSIYFQALHKKKLILKN